MLLRRDAAAFYLALMQHFAGRDVRELTTRDYFQFMSSLAKKRPDLSTSTRNLLSATFRNVLKVARDEGVIDALPSTPRTRQKDNPRAFSRRLRSCTPSAIATLRSPRDQSGCWSRSETARRATVLPTRCLARYRSMTASASGILTPRARTTCSCRTTPTAQRHLASSSDSSTPLWSEQRSSMTRSRALITRSTPCATPRSACGSFCPRGR